MLSLQSTHLGVRLMGAGTKTNLDMLTWSVRYQSPTVAARFQAVPFVLSLTLHEMVGSLTHTSGSTE